MVSTSSAQQALQLLRTQYVSQLVMGDAFAGLSMTDFMLGKTAPRRSGKDIMNDALTGLMRSDSAMLRQASRNMADGKSVYDLAGGALKGITENLEGMKRILADIQSGAIPNNPTAIHDAKVSYMDYASGIGDIIDNTSFNGISLTDKSLWQNNPQVAVQGDYGKLSIQAGKSPTELTLSDLSGLKTAFSPAQVNMGNATQTIRMLDEKLSEIGALAQTYQARGSSFGSEAAYFNRQAGLLSEAAKRSQNEGLSLKDVLLDLLLSEQGGLVNSRS